MVWKMKTWFELILAIFSIIGAVPLSITYNKEKHKKDLSPKPTSQVVRVTSNNVQQNTKDLKRLNCSMDIIRLRYVWNIKNLHLSDFINRQALNSSTFSAENDNKCEWYLFLYPNGYDEDSKDHASLFVKSLSSDITANVHYGFISANNEKVNSKRFVHTFKEGKNWGFPKFIEKDFIFNEENGFFVNDSLTVFCEIHYSSIGDKVANKSEPLQLPLKDDVGHNLEFLLDNELFSDVIISSSGKDFPALKGILAARSPIFKAMFASDINISLVDLADVSDDVVKEMLRYIYTGEVSNLNNLVPNLLVVAEKYELVGLKTICENFISSNRTVQNSVGFYILADTYCMKVKSEVKDFIVAHAKDILVTPEFKTLIQTHPPLAEEILSGVSK